MIARFLPALPVAAALLFAVTAIAAEKSAGAQESLRPAPVLKAAGESSMEQFFNRVDPKADAETWAAEAFADRAGAVLKKLDEAMVRGVPEEGEQMKQVATTDFVSPALRPAALREVFGDASLKVLRGENQGPLPASQGAAALSVALRSWLGAYPPGTEMHTKFKIVEVELDEKAGTARTRAFVQSSGQTPAGIVQQSATWDCRWKLNGVEPPQLLAITVTDYEEVQPVPQEKAEPLFVDRASSVLGKTDAWRDILVHGLDHWFKQVDAGFQIAQGYHGVCVRDVDGDDREDVFLCQPAGIHNMMLKRGKDGTLTDISAAAGLDYLDNTRSALFLDLDNDGDADAAVSLGYEVMIMENDGKGRFSPKTNINMGSWMMSMVAADYDQDGRLDLYLCGYSPRDATTAGDLLANPVPYHDANNGARNFLVRNEGGFRFTDTTQQTGMDANNRKFTNAAAWEDYDDDGDLDLYVANDFGRKNLYRNDLIKDGQRQAAATFTDVADAAGVPDLGAGMSAAWADYDRDGRMDLYVANMFSSAGRRIASQRNFKSGETAENRAGLLRLARGNSLFRNKGDGAFEDVSEPSGTVLGRWAWASLFADINNDGWEDLHVCNGFYTRPDLDDL